MLKGRKSIAFLIPGLGTVDRGAEIFVYELAKNLSDTWAISLLVNKSAAISSLVTELDNSGIRIIRYHSGHIPKFFAYLFERFQFIKNSLDKFHLNPEELALLIFSLKAFPNLMSSNYDLLFPNNGFWGALICRIIRLLKGTPFIYTSHGGIEPWIALQKPDIYIATNNEIKQYLEKHYPALKVRLIGHGVNINRFTRKRKKAKIRLPRPIFLSACACVPTKQIDLTISAIAKLKSGSYINLGIGPLRNDLQKLAETKIGPGRFLFISVPHDKMPEYYRSADVFTHAAFGEASGLVYKEALACNLPIVAPDESYTRKLIGPAGIFCNTNNPTEYTRALKMAVQTKFGILPQKQAAKYSWSDTAAKYNKLIDSLFEEQNF